MAEAARNRDLQLIPATAADAEILSLIAIQGFSETFGYLYTPENLAMHMEKTCSPEFFVNTLAEGNIILMAYLGHIPVGYVKVGKVSLPVQPDFHAMELQRLYVLNPYQGNRIGDVLIEAALALPLMQQAQGIYLGVWENNHRARKFYAKYGFTQVGEYLYHVGPHTDHELIMLRKQAPL